MKRVLLSIISLFLALSAVCGLTACVEESPKDGNEPINQTAYDRNQLKNDFLTLADEVIVNEDSVTFKDASGAESITISKNPQKVYNLYASFTTLWYEAGGTVAGCIGGSSSAETYNEYIGRDITEDEGVEVVATSSSGSKWSVESIISGQPDLIICSTAMSGYKTISSPAAAASIPVIAVSYDSFQDYLKWFKVFCNLTGNPELWNSVAMDALDKVLDVLMEIPLENNPTVFCMFSGSSSLQANLSTTVVGGMLKLMRATNIADDWYNVSGATRLDINLETVYARQPDMIFVQCHGVTEENIALVEAAYGDNPIWNDLNAIKNNKIYYLEKVLFHNKPNSRFAKAYQIMAQLLYPEVEFSFMKESN